MEKKTISIGKETLAYVDCGKGDVVLMIHGNMSSSIHFEPLIERLKDDYRCVAVDLRGFGDSSYNNRFDTLEELADDVSAFIDALDLGAVNLVGWSNGGGVGLKLCAKYPEKVKKFFAIEGADHKGYPVFKKVNFQSTGEPYENKEAMAMDPMQVGPVVAMFATGDSATMSSLWDMTIYTINKPTQDQSVRRIIPLQPLLRQQMTEPKRKIFLIRSNMLPLRKHLPRLPRCPARLLPSVTVPPARPFITRWAWRTKMEI